MNKKLIEILKKADGGSWISTSENYFAIFDSVLNVLNLLDDINDMGYELQGSPQFEFTFPDGHYVYAWFKKKT